MHLGVVPGGSGGLAPAAAPDLPGPTAPPPVHAPAHPHTHVRTAWRACCHILQVRAYYSLELAWYLHLLLKPVLRYGLADGRDMLAHHAASLLLIVVSYGVNLTRMGVQVLALFGVRCVRPRCAAGQRGCGDAWLRGPGGPCWMAAGSSAPLGLSAVPPSLLPLPVPARPAATPSSTLLRSATSWACECACPRLRSSRSCSL